MGTRVTVLVAIAAACGHPDRPSETRVEAELRRAVGAAIGARVARVTCTGPRCIALVDGVEIPLTVRDDGARLAWEVAGLVVTAVAVETEVGSLLGELAVTARVDCGPRVRVVEAGARIECAITGATRDGARIAEIGRAWARIDADGRADVELALGEAAVSARTRDIAEADLEALSRALDDGTAGEDDDAGDAAPARGSGAGDAAPARGSGATDAAPGGGR